MGEEHCSCGHQHDHGHVHHTPGEIAGLRRKKEQLSMLQDNMREIQQLHDKIDGALARENVGFILTQRKTLKELKKLAEKVLGKGKEPIFATLYAAERDYIENIEDIMHQAQILKRAGQGRVTPEVLANMEKSLKAAEDAAK